MFDPCPTCKGSGIGAHPDVGTFECMTCGGRGWLIPEELRAEVKAILTNSSRSINHQADQVLAVVLSRLLEGAETVVAMVRDGETIIDMTGFETGRYLLLPVKEDREKV